MKYPIELKSVSSRLEYYHEVNECYKEAVSYLESFAWCKKINNACLYLNLGEVLCIFLFDVDNTASTEDNLLWIVVGDLPPMYLDTFGPKSTLEVIEDYVRLAEDWIQQVKAGGSLSDCYPFNVVPSQELADLFQQKVLFMKNTLITNIEDIPIHV